MLPQEESLNIPTEFLLQHGYRKVEAFYGQIIADALRSAFTITLAKFLMWKCEKELIHRQETSEEVYGRYVLFVILIKLFTCFVDIIMMSSLL
jgi:hypothetical protein